MAVIPYIVAFVGTMCIAWICNDIGNGLVSSRWRRLGFQFGASLLIFDIFAGQLTENAAVNLGTIVAIIMFVTLFLPVAKKVERVPAPYRMLLFVLLSIITTVVMVVLILVAKHML